MATLMRCPTFVKAPGRFTRRLRRRGFTEGPPERLDPTTVQIDREIVQRHMVCPLCKRRGLQFHPFHNADQYAAVGRCPSPGCKYEGEV
jgi:hypothetical protein